MKMNVVLVYFSQKKKKVVPKAMQDLLHSLDSFLGIFTDDDHMYTSVV